MSIDFANKGAFIVLEGIDGSGKTTQREKIAEWFRSHGIEPVITREPGGTLMAEEIRSLVLKDRAEKVFKETELLMMSAARVQHINHVVIPAVESGKVVISDRYVASTYAYQVYMATKNMDCSARYDMEDLFISISDVALKGFKPDVTLYLNANAEVVVQRLKDRGELNRLDNLDADYLNDLGAGYLRYLSTESGKVVHIQASDGEDQVFSNMIPHLMTVVNHVKKRPGI